MLAGPHPDDLVCELKLERALRRLGFSPGEAAQLVGVTTVTFDHSCAVPPRGWRERVEKALDLAPGALRFR